MRRIRGSLVASRRVPGRRSRHPQRQWPAAQQRPPPPRSSVRPHQRGGRPSASRQRPSPRCRRTSRTSNRALVSMSRSGSSISRAPRLRSRSRGGLAATGRTSSRDGKTDVISAPGDRSKYALHLLRPLGARLVIDDVALCPSRVPSKRAVRREQSHVVDTFVSGDRHEVPARSGKVTSSQQDRYGLGVDRRLRRAGG